MPGAGVTRAVVQAPPRLHVFDAPSGPTDRGPSRTVSATATAATAASAWREAGSPHEGQAPVPHRGAGEAGLCTPEPSKLPGPCTHGTSRLGEWLEQRWAQTPPQGLDFPAPPPSSSRNRVTTVVRTDGQGPPPHPWAICLGAPRGTTEKKAQ